MKKGWVIGVILVLILMGVYYYNNNFQQTILPLQDSQMNENGTVPNTPGPSFGIPKKTPHFENSVPTHKDIIVGSPINVVINFNFDLSSISDISVMRGGVEYGEGSIIIGEDKISMRKNLKILEDGIYDVAYKACWPDNSCHNGNFQFAVDTSLRENFVDLRNQTEVQVSLDNIAFNPAKIIISPGTKVIWTNNEAVTHYINSDPHPGHNYFLEQNSNAMGLGDKFSLTFSKPGFYPYHCSPHASVMKAEILVE